ncbi:zinc-ribbon domain-containing protein [Roseivivax sp. CAU 1753]
MRLICPNCSAQYEVPTEVIPEAGRDVQCSNCGHTWFQHHPDNAPEQEADPDADLARSGDSDAEAAGSAEASNDTDADTSQLPAPETQPTPPSTGTRRGLDPSVAEVLREEAEREAQARRVNGGGLESQPELGLESPVETEEERRARQARDRMAKMRGPAAASADADDTASGADAAPKPEAISRATASSRSEMLPDIDEINQTLRAATDRRPVETAEGRAPDEAEPPRSGFARGLSIGVLIAILLLAVYVFAAPIAEAVPALAPVLDVYVAQANDLRVWLQSMLEGLGQMVGGNVAGSETPGGN